MSSLLRFLLCFPLFTSAAAYSRGRDEGHCLIFEKVSQQGAFWASQAQDQPVSTVTDWWENRAASVWVEKGYVLELHADKNFQGESRFIHGGPEKSGYQGKAGTALDLERVNFTGKLSSFKCRHVGDRLVSYPDLFHFLAPLPLFYQNLSWTEIIAGDPRLWTAKMIFDEGDVILRIRVGHQSAPMRPRYEYRMNLRTAAIHIRFENLGFGDGDSQALVYDKTIDYVFGHHNLEYRGALTGMEIAAQQIAQGYDYGSGYSQSPSPELKEIADELKRILTVQ